MSSNLLGMEFPAVPWSGKEPFACLKRLVLPVMNSGSSMKRTKSAIRPRSGSMTRSIPSRMESSWFLSVTIRANAPLFLETEILQALPASTTWEKTTSFRSDFIWIANLSEAEKTLPSWFVHPFAWMDIPLPWNYWKKSNWWSPPTIMTTSRPVWKYPSKNSIRGRNLLMNFGFRKELTE